MINLKDALQERSLVDRWGFVGFAVLGSALIWILKETTELEVEYLALGAVAVMILYAWLVTARGTGKLRADQAGDNCYYLGLIYTLVSLSHAIFTFDPANTATTIVQGFGIALATTIFGLVLRVFFNQSRVDVIEMEDTARLELAEAAARLKTQLAQITNGFRDFAFGLQQSLGELRQAATDGIAETNRASAAALNEMAGTSSKVLQDHGALLGEQAGELAKASKRSVAAIEKQAAGLEELTARQVSAADGLKIIEALASSAADIGEQMRAHLESASDSQARIDSAAREYASTVSRLTTSVETSLSALEGVQSAFEDRLKRLEAAPRERLDSAMAAVAEAAESLKVAIDGMASEHERAGKSIERLSSGVVGSLEAHNGRLEAELERSRENVAKVHGALVDMTARLAERVEGGHGR